LLPDDLRVAAIAVVPRIPIALEIGDQLGAEKTIGLIARVSGAVAAK
jgi:hypothetical protein